MVEFMKVWCEEIIVSIIIAIIIEMFVPQGNIKKYVRVVVGIYIVFVIINPIISNLDNININSIINEYSYSNTILPKNKGIKLLLCNIFCEICPNIWKSPEKWLQSKGIAGGYDE